MIRRSDQDPPSGGRAGERGDAMRIAHATIEEVLRQNPSATVAQINAALERSTEGYNRAPQRDLGGLSPEQVGRLIYDDWSGKGAVRLNGALPFEEVEQSRILHNVRTFLAALADEGSVRATALGNLPRAFVRAMSERLRYPAGFRGEYLSGRLNEEDLRTLHTARVLCDLARLIKRRKGAFSLTRRGTELVGEEKAGELFALLFFTHFRELNLAWLDRASVEAPGFQQTIAYSLYQFGRAGDAWNKPAALAPALILPSVRVRLGRTEYTDWAELLTKTRLLRPLTDFALAESRDVPGSDSRFAPQEYRPAPLYSRFLSFALG
jgi:hypothetical protein